MVLGSKKVNEIKRKIALLGVENETIGLEQIHILLMRWGIPDPYNRRLIIENLIACDLIREHKAGIFRIVLSKSVGILNDQK